VCSIANIALNDAMILPYNANLRRMEFSEGTGADHLYFALFVMRTNRFPHEPLILLCGGRLN
jgi:hypothetical protein